MSVRRCQPEQEVVVLVLVLVEGKRRRRELRSTKTPLLLKSVREMKGEASLRTSNRRRRTSTLPTWLHPEQGISFKSQMKLDLPRQAGERKQEMNSQTSQPLPLLPRIIQRSVALQRLTSLVPEAHQTNDGRPHAPGRLPGAFVKTR